MRYYVVLDIAEDETRELSEVADWIAIAMARNLPHVSAIADPTVYGSVDDLLADIKERAGPFA